MDKYIRNQETISSMLHDELVMVDIELGKYFSLNPVATRIWALLEHPQTLESICGKLMEEYDVDEAQCRSDVDGHLSKMKELGLVKLIGDGQ